MKKLSLLVVALIALSTSKILAQTALRAEVVGHQFHITVPDYMIRTIGINDAASVQFKNDAKDVYSFVIEDSKADLLLVDMKFSSAKEFYDNFIKDFVKDMKGIVQTTPKEFTKEGVKYVQTELSYYDKEVKGKIYYNITIAETKDYFYKILSYTSEANKATLREDLTNLATTIRD
ncbi:MAG: hypothetical protein CFE21_06220 [Bacteroidetes bacterium B1(2017)]|nr:MAG: hypothetical protein CFE21_06220 [Bacteroidetes bacterium B1(2017)]